MSATYDGTRYFRFYAGLASLIMTDVTVSFARFIFDYTPDTIDRYKAFYCGDGVYVLGNTTITGAYLVDVQNADIRTGAASETHAIARDIKSAINTVTIARADSDVKEQYTCNISVADKDGTLIDGVEVLCEDKDDAQVFTTTTGDTDTGKIDEQVITYKTWTGTSETLVTSSPHKFTLSKAGYETLTLDNITVDGPIDWHLELQDPGGGSSLYKNIGLGVQV